MQQPLRPPFLPSLGPTNQNTKRCQQAGELLGGSLVSLHNVAFMNRLMAAIREVCGESMGPIDWQGGMYTDMGVVKWARD